MIPKFRAWDKEFNLMSVVTRLDYWSEIVEMSDGELYIQKLDKIELMQSTGIFDKNNTEIFEGDIVDYKGRKAIIKWHGSYASFIYRFVDEMQERVPEWDPLFLAYHHFEIIGNIYENKDILEEKK